MDYQFTLKRFFVLVFLFVVCPIVAWVAYAHRTNAPANAFLSNEKDSIFSDNVTIPDENLDATTPFYDNEASKKLNEGMHRPTSTDLWNHGEEGESKGEEKHGDDKKVPKPTGNNSETTKPDSAK
jgi:hypothetical protein